MPIHLSNFGGVSGLYFDNGGYARVEMGGPEIHRLVGVFQRFALRNQRIPDPQILNALDAISSYFSADGPGYGINITADVVIAHHGVTLEPIVPKVL